VIAVDQEWRLSPAYDLTPTVAVSVERRDRAMICEDRSRYANAENRLSQCERFLRSGDEATRILAEMEAMVKQRWYEVARREGMSEQDCERIGTSFAYDGFRLSLEAAA
jgi:serine/threonine-protein kinase HipA